MNDDDEGTVEVDGLMQAPCPCPTCCRLCACCPARVVFRATLCDVRSVLLPGVAPGGQ